MILDKIDFEIGNYKGLYRVRIKVNETNIFDYEFIDLFKNLLSLVEIGFTLQREPVDKVYCFTLTDYNQEVNFKISPNPPMDWLILGIPVVNSMEKFRFNRLDFCKALKSSIIEFMRNQNMDYLGNSKMPKNLDGYGDEVWKVIGHEWF
ncbi:hypothetical protein [Psychrobacter alimentarius]|uniref:hypothetical protein n=1 Tax=Psychrobacter alimentarius TaxID=261164 RepID=UPI00191A7B70|nr:hypothetical protein [Psychrobacter alimentarius]